MSQLLEDKISRYYGILPYNDFFTYLSIFGTEKFTYRAIIEQQENWKIFSE